MIGAEKGRYREKVARLVADAEAAEQAGFRSIWVPQVPNDFDALTAIALMGRATSRVELATAVMPMQTRHPIAMAQQALSNQAVCEGRFTLGLGPSHHWIVADMLGLPYDRPAHLVRNYLEVLNAAFAGPGSGRRRERRLPRAQPARRHRPPADADPARRARAGDARGSRASTRRERSSGWPTSARSASTSCPASRSAADAAGRPAPRVVAGVPVALCRNDEVDDARSWANQALGHAEFSPNYQRLLEHGDADRCRRPLRGRRRVGGRRPVAQLPRRGRHRPLGAGVAARCGP